MLEPQQPEGEVVNACKGCSVEGIQPGCSEEDKNKCDRWDLAKAQLAHMKTQGWVKLPSEDEVADRLRTSFEENGYRNYRETAQELLRLLKEGK